MNLLFYGSSAVAVLCAILTITRRRPLHALVYLVVLFLAMALILYTLGAHFPAALEIIIYAGAILVLFVFAVMLLGGGPREEERERNRLHPTAWIIPGLLCLVLLILTLLALLPGVGPGARAAGAAAPVSPAEVGAQLFGDYILGVELASVLLLAGLLAAFHFGVFPSERRLGSNTGGGNEQSGRGATSERRVSFDEHSAD